MCGQRLRNRKKRNGWKDGKRFYLAIDKDYDKCLMGGFSSWFPNIVNMHGGFAAP